MTTVSAAAPLSAVQGDPLAGRTLLFVIGCPRSGTTWLQLLLAQHPSVATANETHLFGYLAPLARRWTLERSRQGRAVGLPALLSEAEFESLCREMAVAVLARIAGRRPAARLVLEKTPGHILHGPLILRLFPDAWFIHVVRDPRAVVASLLSAGREAWGSWAPARLTDAVRQWQEAVQAGAALARATERYREVRYERLLEDGAEEFSAILRWLGLSSDPAFPGRALEACRLDKLRAGAADAAAPWDLAAEPQGFFRRGEADGWRRDLSRLQLRAIEHLAGPQMEALGYAPVSPSRRPPAALRALGWLEALDRGCRRLFERLRI
jgi:hypothetical protein